MIKLSKIIINEINSVWKVKSICIVQCFYYLTAQLLMDIPYVDRHTFIFM